MRCYSGTVETLQSMVLNDRQSTLCTVPIGTITGEWGYRSVR